MITPLTRAINRRNEEREVDEILGGEKRERERKRGSEKKKTLRKRGK